MTNLKKQLKITKLFRKDRVNVAEDFDELQNEIQELEQKLQEKQRELFQIQRNKCKRKVVPSKRRSETFVRPKQIVLSNSINSLKLDMELMILLSGMEVQEYVADGHCCVVYHMQHPGPHAIKHGIKINLKNGANEVSKCSLPLGFNFNAVLEEFDSVMTPEFLGAVRKALVAYYYRLEQFEALKRLLNVEAQVFKVLDSSHMEISFAVHNETEEDDEQFDVVLVLDYRLYDIRPKSISFKDTGVPEEIISALKDQCAMFKAKPLHRAFKDAFISGLGQYKLVHRVGFRPAERQPPRRPRPRAARYDHNNDDTFRPDECSDTDDDVYPD